MKVCQHCGAVWDSNHEDNGCPVASATMRILADYRPRGMTARFSCPNGHGDGVWEWGPQSKSFKCMKCGVLVDIHTGEPLVPA
jgi:rubredoxin